MRAARRNTTQQDKVAAAVWTEKSLCFNLAALALAMLATVLMSSFLQHAFELYADDFGPSIFSTGQPEQAPVVEPALMNLFGFDAHLLEQSKTPARLNEVQGKALSELLMPAKKKCCDKDDVMCRISAVAPKYIPDFLKPYLLGPQEVEDESINFFDWVVTVCDQSIWTETTPAFLLGGPTDEESGISFYQMTQGHSRNPDPEEIDLDLQELIEEDFKACAESDSVSDILSRVFTFRENTLVQETVWLARTTFEAKANFQSLLEVTKARFRELPAVRFHYHLQGTIIYEEMKRSHDFGSTCEELWTEHPALRPKTLWEKLRDDLFFRTPSMPSIRRRSCADVSPASGGVDPIEVAQCHAYARDPSPVDLHKFPPKKPWKFAPDIEEHVTKKRNAMPLVDETCHANEFRKYEFMQRLYDYSDVCSELWADHPRTNPKARRQKWVQRDDGSATTWWKAAFEKNSNLAGLESFCLSRYLDRKRAIYYRSDPSRNQRAPKPDNPLLQLVHSD